jgi:hypothetical protein
MHEDKTERKGYRNSKKHLEIEESERDRKKKGMK